MTLFHGLEGFNFDLGDGREKLQADAASLPMAAKIRPQALIELSLFGEIAHPGPPPLPEMNAEIYRPRAVSLQIDC